VGFDLGFALYRRRPLAPEELGRLEQHLRVWRTRIIGYDWNIPRDPQLHSQTSELIAWGSLRPTRGQPGVSDQGGYLPDVLSYVHSAIINARDLIRDSRIAVADAMGPLAWSGAAFEYNELAEVPALPASDGNWVSLAQSRNIPDGRAQIEAANMERRRRPTTRGAAALALAQADPSTLISLVLAPLAGRVSDLERTAAVERLAEIATPEACAALVQRARMDGTERKWTAVVLRGLAGGRQRGPWATAILAFDRGWRGAAEALVANVTDSAIPHLERLPIARLWSAFAMLGLDAVNTNAAREAKRRLLDRVVDPLPHARLDAIDAIASAFRATGPQVLPALEHVRDTLATYARLGGDAQTWLSHQREAGQRALAAVHDAQVTEGTIMLGLAALAEFAVTGRDPVRLDEHHRTELLKLEAEWLAQNGYAPT
jgi:hypothetical protein